MKGFGKVAAGVMLAGLLAVMGCVTTEVGRRFNTAAAERIEIGKTTETEVLAWLGQPSQQMVRRDKGKVYFYNYNIGQTQAGFWGPTATGAADRLMIIFDKDNVVSGLNKGSTPMRLGPGLTRQNLPEPKEAQK